MSFNKLTAVTSAKFAFALATMFTLVLSSAYIMMEPRILSAQASDTAQFTVSQTIGDAIAITLPGGNTYSMEGTIDGVSGGQATATVSAVVTTNDPDGYNLQITFTNASSSMVGETTASEAIRDYDPTDPNVPDYDFSASTSALFAYSVTASSGATVADIFKDNDVICNQGAGSQDANKCWMRPSDGDLEIVTSSAAAGGGSTTTLKFVVHVPNNPSPAVEADTYTATATLTATNNL